MVAIASKLNQEKNMSISVMTKAQHWRLVLKMSYEAGARNAIGLGVKPAAIKAAIRRHREREEAARENLDALAARKPGGAVKRWTLLCLGVAIDEADFRTTTHGHTTYAEVADFASVQGYVTNHRPSELGLPNAYANKGFTVACSTHSFQVTPAWIRDVKMRGCAVVGGLLTLDLGPEIEPGIFQATWVEQGRGTTLRARTGHLVDIGHGLWKHADSLIAARRVHRAGHAPPPVEKPALPRDAKKLLSRAKLTGNETVTRGFARLAGHCEAGIRDWVARHGLDAETEITTRRLAEAACDSGDRIEDVYLVLLAVSRAARKARAA